MKIQKKYKPLFTSKSRYFIVTGGRGSGKSFSVTIFLTLLTMSKGFRTLFTRFTMVSAHLSIIPEFLEKIDLLKLSSIFRINKTDVTNTATDSDILFKGIKTGAGNQTASLKSLQGVCTWVLDEAEELTNEDTFDTIDLSIRSQDKPNRIILIMNPTTKEHWIYKKFFEEKGVTAGFNGTKDDVTYIHTSYLDNIKNLSKSFIRQVELMKINNPKKYAHKILGGWLDKADGVVFDDWEFGTFNPNGLQTSCGMDFGFSVDPDTLTEVAIDKKRKLIYLKEHIYQNGLKTDDLAKLILSRIQKKLVISEVDPRLVADLKHRGVNIKQHKKGQIETGITKMLEYKLIVEPNSTNIAKELNNYAYSDKTSKLYIDDYNHSIDGARYNIEHHLNNPNRGNYNVS